MGVGWDGVNGYPSITVETKLVQHGPLGVFGVKVICVELCKASRTHRGEHKYPRKHQILQGGNKDCDCLERMLLLALVQLSILSL